MPMFRFDRDDADAMVAYIRSIQGAYTNPHND
jgi:hypothetical protein